MHELHAARGTARVTPARVQHVNRGVLLDGEDESFSGWHVYTPKPLNSQRRHVGMVTYGKSQSPEPRAQSPNSNA